MHHNNQSANAKYGKTVFGLAALLLASVSVHEASAQYTDFAAATLPVENRPASYQGQGGNRRGNQTQVTPEMQLNEALLKENPEDKKAREEKIKAELNEKSYQKAQDTFMPMSEEEIRRLLGHLRTTQEAIQTPIAPPPVPEIHVEEMSLDPASPPPVVQLAVGNVSTITFLDMTGEPWPVIDIAQGGEFDVKPPEPGGHVIRVTPLKEFGTGNLSVRLLNFKTPVTFELRSGGDVVHYRYDARIPEIGPNGKVPIMTERAGISAGDKTLLSVLEGILPENAEALKTDGADGRTTAFEVGRAVLVRTPLTMLSPAWTASVSSADGMNVYSIPDTPVLLLSKNGEIVRVHLSRKGDTDVE